MLYEFKLSNSAAEAARNVALDFTTDSPSERTVRCWFAKFSSGDFDLEDKPGRGRRMSLDDQALKAAVETKLDTTIRTLAAGLGVHYATVSKHLASIGMVRKMQKWTPHDLTDDQQSTRYEICSNLLVRQKNEPFLDRLITVDEKWLLFDNKKRGYVWVDKFSTPPSFTKPDLHPRKGMLTVWWCCKGVIHYSLLQPGQAVTSESYCCDLDLMYEKLRQMWPGVANRGGPLLLQDNARPHTSKLIRQKLTQLGIEVLPHPPYSPDLSPTDYHFFRALEASLRQQHLPDLEHVKIAFKEFLKSCDLSFYCKGISELPNRWQRCVESEGFCFDK
ncbi:hypothetical protein Y032_0139g2120 [Ancylostoma ceylanicum]|uniref:Mos1 transposase HTH domain-containing protein n=1 Tax=Ancylostoma ceylanicum TaxID=53326 RepID=A0A016T4Q9_9BILA|nr:hypothetical protein Y032_0139g2120 [Ancylostoma ceylanicum]